jgi:hypothetical protein
MTFYINCNWLLGPIFQRPCEFTALVSQYQSHYFVSRLAHKCTGRDPWTVSVLNVEVQKEASRPAHSLHALQAEHQHVRFEVSTAVTMKKTVFWHVTPCGSCKNDLSEELSPFIIRITRSGELGTTILVTLMMEGLSSPKLQFVQEPQGVTCQKTEFFRH